MSWSSTRSAVAGWFGGTPTIDPDNGYTVYRSSPVAGVATLFLAVPTSDNEQDFHAGLADGTATGVKILVGLASEADVRRTMGQGYRMATYAVTLDVFGLSRAPHAEQAETDFDLILDGLKSRLFSSPDHTLGSQVFQAGEGDAGWRVRREPAVQTERGKVYLYAQVAFEVWEFRSGV